MSDLIRHPKLYRLTYQGIDTAFQCDCFCAMIRDKFHGTEVSDNALVIHTPFTKQEIEEFLANSNYNYVKVEIQPIKDGETITSKYDISKWLEKRGIVNPRR